MKKVAIGCLHLCAILAIAIAGVTLVENEASAEAGICCTVSSDCPDRLICYVPSGGQTACCTVGTPGCSGANYCHDDGILD